MYLSKKHRLLFKELNSKLDELEWAHIFHDSIKGFDSLNNLSLNIGRWAGNYSFFYVLFRILKDFKPNTVLDLGLGESSKFISTYIQNYDKKIHHTIVEQSQEWIDYFNSTFSLNEQTHTICCEIEQKDIKGFKSNYYKDLPSKLNNSKMDLVIVDGPFGSDHYSRYNVVELFEKKLLNDEFIVLIDDYEREGEQETAKEFMHILKQNAISFDSVEYQGKKKQLVIATPKYKYALSL